MAYRAEVVRRARQRLEAMKADRQSQEQQQLQAAYARVPRLLEIDQALRSSMAKAAQAAFLKGGDAAQAMEQVKQANLALQQERAALVAANFAPGSLEERPVCDRCGGSGYLGSQMCSCLGELCRQEVRKELSLQGGFGDFRLEYYDDRVDSTYGASPRAIMERNLKICRRYAEGFGPGSGNLLFVGGTGLGKTLLSAAIANAVAENGWDVVYETAGSLFSVLEKNRFSPSEETREAAARLMSCELLVLDDLGTELPGQFVTAALYNLLNDRLLAGRAMVVSTNLNVDEIARRYSPQIASRLQGNFLGLTFVGQDIRVLKNRGVLR